jgi:putative ABC transport system permease protein
MDLSETFLSAVDTISAHKLRAALTMLGVIIGVAAVIALMAIGNGVQSSITGQITSVGSNLIVVSPNLANSNGYPPLGLADAEALKRATNTAIAEVAAAASGNREVTAGGNSVTTPVLGVTANYLKVVNLAGFQAGDGLTQADVDRKARVVVLGASAASDLFDGANPVGRQVKIGGATYEVVGVLKEQGQTVAGTPDENVYMPISTAQARLFPERTRTGDRAVSSITVQAAGETQADAAVAQIESTLRQSHKLAANAEADFNTFSQTALLNTVNTVTGTLTAFLGAIAGISLLVGGIGIMNIMLVSVTERTREIGVRKAIGALRRDIMAQFLLESTLVSVIGGLIGIAVGWLLAQVASMALNLGAVVDVGTVLLATGFAGAVGLIFGGYPAWRAAKLRPIEALRYE